MERGTFRPAAGSSVRGQVGRDGGKGFSFFLGGEHTEQASETDSEEIWGIHSIRRATKKVDGATPSNTSFDFSFHFFFVSRRIF